MRLAELTAQMLAGEAGPFRCRRDRFCIAVDMASTAARILLEIRFGASGLSGPGTTVGCCSSCGLHDVRPERPDAVWVIVRSPDAIEIGASASPGFQSGLGCWK